MAEADARKDMYSTPWLAAIATLVAISLAVFAYQPGLVGPFLFDDFGTLAALGELGGVRDWATMRAFVLGGDSGPSGRPLSLLSFLIDGTTWPADPWPFKRTNLVIHIITSLALADVTRRLLLAVGTEPSRARWLALASATLWLLHPFLLSTTLYIVQRMAQLSTLFVLVGLSGYMYGRSLLSHNPVRGHIAMATALTLGTGLAILCKENGVLLPILVLVTELTVFSAEERSAVQPNRAWLAIFVVVPSIVVFSYLLTFAIGDNWLVANPDRGISVYERVLTQTRILFDYLHHWFIPSLYTSGVFQDHHTPSTGLFRPLTTALSLLGHIAIVSFAVATRRKYSIASFAVLFFYAAHLLESSFVNLELYFEHRNYLPAAFLSLLILLPLSQLTDRRLAIGIVVVMCLTLFSLTRYSADVWSSYRSIVTAAANAAPNSARAQQQYALILFNSGDMSGAQRVMSAATTRLPQKESLQLYKTILSCTAGRDASSDFMTLSELVSEKMFDVRLFQHYEALTTLVSNGNCEPISLTDLRSMYAGMQKHELNRNPRLVGFHQLYFLIGFTELQLGNITEAQTHFRQSLHSRPTPGRAMLMAAVMASNEEYYSAKVFSDIALAMLDTQADHNSFFRMTADVQAFREQLRTLLDDVRTQGGHGLAPPQR